MTDLGLTSTMASQPETFSMTARLSTRAGIDRLKAAAAHAEVNMVEDGTIVASGSGSMAPLARGMHGQRVKRFVPCR